MTDTPDNAGFSLGRTFGSLRFPNFRLWMMGQLTSLFGTWMQVTAMSYFAYEITGSKTFLGTVAFAAGLPTIALMFFGGFAADHLPRRRLLVAVQSAMMLLAFGLAALAFFKAARDYHLIIFALAGGVANAFDAPARQAFILDMVDRKSLSNAIALNSTMFNLATAVGPALGGAAYHFIGPAWCFLVNGVSFLAVIVALLAMKIKARPARPSVSSRPLRGVVEGIAYIAREPRIRVLILISTMVGVFGFSMFALFPAWAKEMLAGDELTNGLLQSARGVGALAATLFIASRGGRGRRAGSILTGMFIVPAGFIAFSFAAALPLALAIVVVIGLGMLLVFNLANTVIQDRVQDRFRGRVMSVYSLTFFGAAPVGSLAAGALSDAVGLRPVVIGCSTVLIVLAIAAALYWRRLKESGPPAGGESPSP